MPSYSDTIRRVMENDFEGSSEEERDRAVKDVIQVCSIAAAAVAVQPLPLIDVALLSPIQVAMVQAIGRIRGYKLDTRSVLEMLSTFGASLVAQGVIFAAIKFVPFLGWVMGISMAYALTWAVGEVSDHYFKTGRGAKPEELQAMFNKVYEAKRAEKEAANRGNTTLKEKLEQLKSAYSAGLLTEEEFNQKKEQILASF